MAAKRGRGTGQPEGTKRVYPMEGGLNIQPGWDEEDISVSADSWPARGQKTAHPMSKWGSWNGIIPTEGKGTSVQGRVEAETELFQRRTDNVSNTGARVLTFRKGKKLK
jgi:hypothetical protein